VGGVYLVEGAVSSAGDREEEEVMEEEEAAREDFLHAVDQEVAEGEVEVVVGCSEAHETGSRYNWYY